METDLKKLLQALKSERRTDRKRINIYVSEEVYETFQKLLASESEGAMSASRIIEVWMEQAIEELRKRK